MSSSYSFRHRGGCRIKTAASSDCNLAVEVVRSAAGSRGGGRAGEGWGWRGGVEEKNTYFTAESVSEESAGNGLDCGASIVIVFLCYLLSSCSNVCFYSQ